MIEIYVTELIDGIELDKDGKVVLKFSTQEDLDGFKEVLGVENTLVLLDPLEKLQYQNLRKHFNDMTRKVLGEGYYNTESDVHGSDQTTCEDITKKVNCRSIIKKWWRV